MAKLEEAFQQDVITWSEAGNFCGAINLKAARRIFVLINTSGRLKLKLDFDMATSGVVEIFIVDFVPSNAVHNIDLSFVASADKAKLLVHSLALVAGRRKAILHSEAMIDDLCDSVISEKEEVFLLQADASNTTTPSISRGINDCKLCHALHYSHIDETQLRFLMQRGMYQKSAERELLCRYVPEVFQKTIREYLQSF